MNIFCFESKISLQPYTYFHIFHNRAGRLTDGPYTSYDLNTLIQATAGERRAVLIGQGIDPSHFIDISISFFPA